jgi:hypothetical protein
MGITSTDLVADKAFKFRRRIEELRSKDYYSDDPKELVYLFDKVVAQISEKIKVIREDDDIGIKRINLLLSYYHLALDEIEHIELDNVPVEMLPLFTRILGTLKLTTILVFRPNPMYNYSYFPITRFINGVNKSQGYPEVKDKCDIAVISFPSSERNSTLLHCSFAHEIGHHLNECFSIAKDIEPKVLELIDRDLLKKYVSKFLELLSKTKRVVGETEFTLDKFILREQMESFEIEQFAIIIRKWLDEIISDTIAIYLFGPAFVFAITEFLLSSQNAEKYSETHPPIFIRLKNLMTLFDELGFSKGLEEYEEVIKRIDYYRTISKKTFDTKDESITGIKNMILERGIVGLFEPARRLVKTRIDLPEGICNFEDSKYAVSAFRNLITGNEILDKNGTSRPIDAVTILNSAWIVRINFINELYSALPNVDKPEVRNILDGLALKSLELQEFHSKMVQAQ